MNNSCPSCGAVYNVAGKDIGRKIRCKKCSSPLIVTEAGLEVDEPAAAAAREPANTFEMGDDEEEGGSRKRGKGKKYAGGGGLDVMQLVRDFGGIATAFFAFGAFLVIVFLFMPIIGAAANERADATKDKLEQERDAKIKKLVPTGKRLEDLTSDERKKYDDDAEKIRKDYEKRIGDATDDARAERTGNKRAKWMEMYGMMFGFVFLMFGSLGYMMPTQSNIRRIVGAIVVTAQMVLVFIYFVIRGAATG